MKFAKLVWVIVGAVFASLAVPLGLAAQQDHQHHHYKLIILGTLGGPQSSGDPGDGAANINNRGIAAGVADTATPDPFYPNFNPNWRKRFAHFIRSAENAPHRNDGFRVGQIPVTFATDM